MKITNRYNLPDSIVRAVTFDSYHREGHISVTELIKPPQMRHLEIVHDAELEEDAGDRLWALLGSAVHIVLERASLDNVLQEERLRIEVNGWTVTGRPDLWHEPHHLKDYKVTCLPTSAEALTRDGWRTPDHLIIGEEILSYDAARDRTTWTPVRDLLRANAPLMSLSGKSFRARSTAEHAWFTESRKSWPLGVNEWWPAKRRRTADLKQHDRMVISAPCDDEGIANVNPEEAALLGWVFTDGWLCWRGNSPSMYVSQKKEPYLSIIRERFADWFASEIPHVNGVATFRVQAGRARDLLTRAAIKSKADLPSLATRLSPEARAAMFEAMLFAEGYFIGERLMNWSQVEGPVKDTFEILGTLHGYRLNRWSHGGRDHKTWYTSLARSTRVYVSALEQRKGHLAEPVWCPVTDNESFVARIDGQVTVTGNSVWSFLLGDKPEWEAQLNLYAALYREHGFPVEDVRILAILRDWQASRVSDEYPPIPFAEHIVRLWPHREAMARLLLLVQRHQWAIEGDYEPCTEEERWARPETWAVKKIGQKRAKTVAPSPEEAERRMALLAQDGKRYEIEHRPGRSVRCERYCQAAPFCAQWAQLNQEAPQAQDEEET